MDQASARVHPSAQAAAPGLKEMAVLVHAMRTLDPGPGSAGDTAAGRGSPSELDTVILDTDAGKLFLLWKGELVVREPTAVRTIRIVPGAGTPPKPASPAA